jgi:ECF transporter S component (folate family)
MSKDLSVTQKITFSAMLLALSVIATFIAKTIPMGSFYYLRFSFTPALIIYTSLTLGPFYGAVVGACSDLIPAFTYSQGEYNFLITFVYMILGILPWLLEKGTRHFRTAFRKPYLFYGVLAVIFAILVAVFYATDWLDSSFGNAAYWAKPTVLAILFVLDIGLCVGLYFTNKYYQKRILENPDIPSPNEIATIALVSEIVVMDLLKALAFWAFYNFLSTKPFPLSYGFVFSMLLMGSPLSILLVTFADSWLLIYTKRFIRAYGYADAPSEANGTSDAHSLLIDDENHRENLSEEEKEDILKQKKAKTRWFIFFTVIILLMIASIVVIKVMQGQSSASSSSSKTALDYLNFLF